MVSIRKLPIPALRSRSSAVMLSSRLRYRTSAQRHGGRIARLTRNSRASSQSRIPTVPSRYAMLPSHESRLSETTRWISPMSLLMRDMMSPIGVRA